MLAIGGVATFGTLGYIATADGQLLEIIANDEDGARTDLASVAAPAVPSEVVATHLGFIVEPEEIKDGEIFGIPPVVAAIDTNNVVDEDFEGTITLTLNNQDAVLTNNALSTVNGVSNFTELTITGLGSGRFLTARTDSLIDGRSHEFSVERVDFLVESTPPRGLDGGSTVVPGEEIQIFSIGVSGDGQHSVSSASLIVADLGRGTGTSPDDFAQLRLYASTDDTLDADDVLLGTLPQDAIKIGNLSTVESDDPTRRSATRSSSTLSRR